ncbi:GPI-GlcNAc transferase complex, PIG-H component-domain-containing protein [Podospora appendiculata]|uniref:GPI-GlcNAc transferase complex, PIG-H component-domain-containing protein n=1 Tax=Podospora appendiculata TaxID=314037 RepID=A0AAE0X3K5_9PEZI|nr:GPI-GlcNAc transferase complex, PIG-H component-domain-containing protein [Podospora appendiculata]
MLTTPPHLYIRRPSPTTAEFTVTTCPPLTIPLRLALLALLTLRITVVLSVIIALYAQFASPPPPPPPNRTTTTTILSHLSTASLLDALLALQTSPPGQSITRLASALPASVLALACAGLLYAGLLLRLHTTESVLVLRGLGIQIQTSSHTAGAGGSARFIPTAKIQDVLINEAFKGFEVRYYLVVVVEGEEDVVVVFPRLLPGRRIVEAVWRGVRGCLYEPGEGGRKDGGVER